MRKQTELAGKAKTLIADVAVLKWLKLKNFERQRNDLRIVAWKLFSVEKLKRLLYRNCSENFFY